MILWVRGVLTNTIFFTTKKTWVGGGPLSWLDHITTLNHRYNWTRLYNTSLFTQPLMTEIASYNTAKHWLGQCTFQKDIETFLFWNYLLLKHHSYCNLELSMFKMCVKCFEKRDVKFLKVFSHQYPWFYV